VLHPPERSRRLPRIDRDGAPPQGATIEELVRALTAIGSTARDIVAILQSLRAAGALEAELEVI